MKTGLALLLLCAALLAAVPAIGEPGDEPGCPWEYMPYREVLRMEEVRQEQIVGGVKGSPYWLWQAYLGSSSIALRLYDVQQPMFPQQLLFRERVRFAGSGSDAKILTLTVREAESVELRADRDALARMSFAGIADVVVKNAEGKPLAAYAVEDMQAIMDFFGLEEGEILCLQGEDAPIYVHTVDGVRKAVTAGN